MTTRFETKLKGLNRRFYEVFGDLEAQVEFLKLMSFILVLLLLFSWVGAYFLAKKPPVVIRVSEVGKAESVKDLKTNNEIEASEILYFAKNFVKRYTEYNAYTLSRDMAEAFNLMTFRFQKTAKQDLVESGFLARLKESGLNTRIEFKEESLERNTPEIAVVSLIELRTITSYKNPDFKESSLFKVEVVLRKSQRTAEAPSGLLVEEYREYLLNKLEDKSQ